MTDASAALATALRDRYTLERELGRGGMATVYLARDLKHKRQVALKVLHAELGAVLGAERFLREIETTARLQHPHILPIFDSGEAAGQLWYTMPFVEGESLRDRLRREVRLELAEARRLVAEVASALDYAHRHGVVHRDIKPGNILLSDGQALVADFGIARSSSCEDRDTLTGTGLSLGTPAYMAPEQASGQEVDGRADVYALGCVAYEALAGAPPYSGPSAHAIIAAHMAQPVPDLHRARPEVAPRLAAAVGKAMAKEPADRFASAAEFADAFAAAASSSGSVTVTAGTPARRRYRLVVAPVAIFLLILAAGGLWMRRKPAEVSSGPLLLAVLPFENQGSSEDEYFADGLADEVRGKLTQVPGLAVIARTSSGHYKRSSKSPKQIGRELGVRYLLTGTVRWDRSVPGVRRVRVSPELLDLERSAQPTTRWQAPFEAPLTDVFRVQSEIARQVAGALDVELTPGTKQRLARQPTTNLAAYEAYLEGLGDPAQGDLATQGSSQLRRSIAALERAVALDPSFALAWAQLARARLYVGQDPSEADSLTRLAVARALAADSTLPAVRLAAGLVAWYSSPDTVLMMQHFEAGLAAAPNDPELLSSVAYERFDPRRPEPALQMLRRAQALDPRSSRIAMVLFRTLGRANRRREAVEVADRLRMLAPHSHDGMVFPITARLAAGAEADARRLVRSGFAGADSSEFLMAMADGPHWLLDENQRDALLRMPVSTFGGDRFEWAALRASVAHRSPDRVAARPYLETYQRELERQREALPENSGLLLMLAKVRAWLGQAAAGNGALRSAKRVAAKGGDKWQYAYFMNTGAAYAALGEADSAVNYIARVIGSSQGSFTEIEAADLRFDPDFALVRAAPQFRVIQDHLEAGSQPVR